MLNMFIYFRKSLPLRVCDALRDLVSVLIWRLHDCSNTCKWMPTLFFYLSAVSVRLYESVQHSNGLPKRYLANQTGQDQIPNNVAKFECCFLISKYYESCNGMSSFTVKRHVPWNTFICSAAQYFHQFVMVFNYCVLSFLVMQQITQLAC